MQSVGGLSRDKGPRLFSLPDLAYSCNVKTLLLPASADSIRLACELLQQDECVAFPTETVYGLGALGLRPAAVAKIFQAKGRPSTDPLILHLPSTDLRQAVSLGILKNPLPPMAEQLAAAFWPGPLTLVLPRGPSVPHQVTAGLETVAVRYPSHPVARQLLTALNTPLAGPSANRFGRISPTDASAVLSELDGKIPLILDGGPCLSGIESTVLSLVHSAPTLLRPGMISPQELSQILGDVPSSAPTNDPKKAQPAPGMLPSHYAPSTPLYLCDQPIENFPTSNQYLLFTTRATSLPPHARLLAPSNQPEESARNLYRMLRTMDQLQPKAILVDPIPDSPLAPALRDRLSRASRGTARWHEGQWIFSLK